ncbi:hypothetical protein DFQ27_002455 [Actinomortierella ambigua]|uniref:WSC domain-containing protein n=1 Tax=Actinomortierella ambigua TaxID=1343610 RepID=A0A9P6Q7E9_9FUNG|nr:hypothetical protein DFQ27_002455 [Actinomortierella ambigua]
MAIGTIDTPPEYQGCFQEDPSKPDLSGEPPLTVSGPEACLLHCAIGTWAYAGIRNGTVCTCGDEKGHYGLAISPAECSTACPPNTIVAGGLVEWCGGASVNSVYKVGNYTGKIPPGSTSTGGGDGGTVGPTELPTHPDHDGIDGETSSGSGGGTSVGQSSAVVIGSIVGSVVVLACGVLLLVMKRRRAQTRAVGSLLDGRGGGGGAGGVRAGDLTRNFGGNILRNNVNHNSGTGGIKLQQQQRDQRRSSVGNLFLQETVRGGAFDSDDDDMVVDSVGATVPTLTTLASGTPMTTLRAESAVVAATVEAGTVSRPRSPTGGASPPSPDAVEESMVPLAATSSPSNHALAHRRSSRQKRRPGVVALKGGHHGPAPSGAVGGRGGLRVETGTGKFGAGGTALSPPYGHHHHHPTIAPVSPVSPVSPISPLKHHHHHHHRQGSGGTSPILPITTNTTTSLQAPSSVAPSSPTTPSATATEALILQAAPNHTATHPQQRSPQLPPSSRNSARRRSVHHLPPISAQESAPPSPLVGLLTTTNTNNSSSASHGDEDLYGLEWSLPYSRPYYPPPASPYATGSGHIPVHERRDHDDDSEGDDGQTSEEEDEGEEGEEETRGADDGHKSHQNKTPAVVVGSVYPRSPSSTSTSTSSTSPLLGSTSSAVAFSSSSSSLPNTSAATIASPPSPQYLRPPEPMRRRSSHSSSTMTMLGTSPPPPRILIHEAE